MTLKAELRSKVGSGSARAARKAGFVPASVYGKGVEPLSVVVVRRELDVVLKTVGLNTPFALELDGKTHNVIVKSVEKAALADEIYAVDFQIA